jgi:hypothetical protein
LLGYLIPAAYAAYLTAPAIGCATPTSESYRHILVTAGPVERRR